MENYPNQQRRYNMEMTPTEIILAITCAAIVLWLYIYAPKLINRLPKFRVEGTRREREQAYMDECWNEVEGKRRKTATATKIGKKGRKQNGYWTGNDSTRSDHRCAG